MSPRFSIFSVFLLAAVICQGSCMISWECQRLRSSCGSRARQQMIATRFSIEYVRSRWGDFCNVYDSVMTCTAECREDLSEDVQYRVVSSVLDYLCDVSRRNQVTEAFGSHCLDNILSAPRRFFATLDGCGGSNITWDQRLRLKYAMRYKNARVVNQYCGQFVNARSCLVSSVGSECGQPMGELIGEVSMVVLRAAIPAEPPVCSSTDETLD